MSMTGLSIKRIKRRARRQKGVFLLFLLGMAAFGFLVQFQWIGYIFIAVYAVLALVRRSSSRLTFVLALSALGMTAISVMLANWLISQNAAAYSFVLFIFGAVQLTIEQAREIRNNVKDTT